MMKSMAQKPTFSDELVSDSDQGDDEDNTQGPRLCQIALLMLTGLSTPRLASLKG
jgi:hypothetical protein